MASLKTDKDGYLLKGNRNLAETLVGHEVGAVSVLSFDPHTRMVDVKCLSCGHDREISITGLYSSTLGGTSGKRQLRCKKCYHNAKRVEKKEVICCHCKRGFEVSIKSNVTACIACVRRGGRNGFCKSCRYPNYKHVVFCSNCKRGL